VGSGLREHSRRGKARAGRSAVRWDGWRRRIEGIAEAGARVRSVVADQVGPLEGGGDLVLYVGNDVG